MKHHRHLLSIFLILLIPHIVMSSEYEDEEEDEEPFCDEWVNHRCTDDKKGYIIRRCNEEKRGWDEVDVVRCPKHKLGCECAMDYDDNFTCKCVNPGGKPIFPDTGVIRWNGTHVQDTYSGTGNPTTLYVPGEIRKDSVGRYLKKMTTVFDNLTTIVEFEMYVPSAVEGMFVKHTGNSISKNCKTEEVSKGADFSSLWEDNHIHYWQKYRLENTTPTREGVVVQEWKHHILNDYDWIDYVFKVELNKKTHIAVPLSFYRDYNSVWYGVKIKNNLVYTYEPLRKDEEAFHAEDYCNMEVW